MSGFRRFVSIAAVALTVGAGACAQCVDVQGCTDGAISYSGQTVDRWTAKTIPGVRISFVRTGGPPVIPDSMVESSDAQGYFDLRGISAPPGDHVIGRLIVDPPSPYHRYVVPNVPLTVHGIRGDGEIMGRVVVEPYFHFIGEVRRADDSGDLPYVSVVFRPRRGVQLPDSVYALHTDFGGFFVFEGRVPNGQFGDIEGEFTIFGPGIVGAATIPVKIPTRYIDELLLQSTLLRVGPQASPARAP